MHPMSHAEELLELSVEGSHITATGEIDAHTAPTLADAITAAGSDVRLDLAGVEFVDSSGLRVLIDAHQRLDSSGGSLQLVAVSDPVRRLLEISGVDGYLHLGD